MTVGVAHPAAAPAGYGGREGRGAAVAPQDPARLRRARALGLLVIVAALAAVCLASVVIGSNPLSPGRALEALVHPDGSEASAIVWSLRVPRTVLGLLTGASFGVAGALIQALTRNPLADPGILGVNVGAGLAVTVGVAFLGISTAAQYVWLAFAGAALATLLVYMVGAAGGHLSPETLVLAGVALGGVLGGVTNFLNLIDPETFQALRTWGLGSIVVTSTRDVWAVAPFLLAGMVLAVGLSGALNSIALGDDLATSLGTNVVRARILGIVAVTLLAGGATALTGGIGFIGLMVPHMVRWCVGPDQRWILSYSILCAPVLLLASDILGRVVARPGEIQAGIVTAVIGAPVLIALVRRRKASGL